MLEKHRSVSVYAAALLYTVLNGCSFVFIKMALVYSDPITSLSHRFLFAFITLLAVLWATGKLHFFSWRIFKDTFMLALTYPLLFFVLQTFGLEFATSAEGGLILSTIPVFTLILAHFLIGEKASRVQVISIGLSVAGVLYTFVNTSRLSASETGTSIIGITLFLGATLAYALYSVLARRYMQNYSNLELLTVMITSGFFGFHLLSILAHFSLDYTVGYLSPFRHAGYWVANLYLGPLCTFLVSLLTNYVLCHRGATQLSVFTNLSTLLSIFVGAVVLGETLYPFHFVGAVLIILGVVGTNLGGRKSPAPKE